MEFDIYGNPLRRGHCEVHPNMLGEYPCTMCIQEKQLADDEWDHRDTRQRDYEEEMKQQAIDALKGVGGDGI